MCHVGGGRVLTNTELLEFWQRMNQTQRTGVELGFMAAYTVAIYGAAGSFATQQLSKAAQTSEMTTADEIGVTKAPPPYPYHPGRSGTAIWFEIGTNDAGTTFYGPDRLVFVDNFDLMQEMGKRGPGIVIDGAHGDIVEGILLEPSFTPGVQKFFSNPGNPYYNQVTVLDISMLTARQLRTLGGPGQRAYVNWCWGGYCSLIINELYPPAIP